ncbi:MAG: hypothetical protein GX852_01675 [Clostridiales bacterium]|nr:hypothetical protein [Clostridiales bacterium]
MQLTISFNHFLAACLLITVIILAVALLLLALSARTTFQKVDVLVDIATDTANAANVTVKTISRKVEEQSEAVERIVTVVAAGLFTKKVVNLIKTLKGGTKFKKRANCETEDKNNKKNRRKRGKK